MKSVINCVIILITLAVFFSCSNEVTLKDGDTIYYPDLDGIQYERIEHCMDLELLLADTEYQNLELDTFELTYRKCNCPDWIDRTKGDIDCKECTDFYIEPADIHVMLFNEILVDGNTVRFYGKLVPGMKLPEYRSFVTDEPSEQWTVIHYYGYEIVRPYKIWGPDWLMYQGGDTVKMPTIKTIQ